MRVLLIALLAAISYAQTAFRTGGECAFQAGGKTYDLTPVSGAFATNDTHVSFCSNMQLPCNGDVGSTYIKYNSSDGSCITVARWKKDDIVAFIPEGKEDLLLQFENGDPCGGGVWKQTIRFVCSSSTTWEFNAEIDPSDPCHLNVVYESGAVCGSSTTTNPTLTTLWPPHATTSTTAAPTQVVDVSIEAYTSDECDTMIPGYLTNIRMPLDGNCAFADPDRATEFSSFQATCVHGSQLTFTRCQGEPPSYVPLGIDMVNGVCNEIQISEITFAYIKVTWTGDYCQGNSSKKIKKHHGFRNAVIALIVIGSILGFLWVLIYGVNFRRRRTIVFAGDLQAGPTSYDQLEEHLT